MTTDVANPGEPENYIRILKWAVREAENILRSLPQTEAIRFANGELFAKLCYLFSSPFFTQQPTQNQHVLIRHAAQLMTTTVTSRKSGQLATLAADAAAQLMRMRQLPIMTKIAVYDAIYILFWASDCSFNSLAPVNRAVVQPFSSYLAKVLPHREIGASVAGRKKRFGYLINFASISPTAAGTALFFSIILGHRAEYPDHEIYIYTFQENNGEFKRLLQGVQIRECSIPADNDAALENFRAEIIRDDLDYLITDASLGVATYLFESRSARFQVYMYMGFPCWQIRNLDLVYGFTIPWCDWMGFDAARYVMGPTALESRMFSEAQDPELLRRERARIFPPDAKVIAFFGRFIKVTDEYLDIIETILCENEDIHFFAAGYGDFTIFDRLKCSAVADRFHLSINAVQIAIYGRIIDVFVDSFPFSGGNVLREMLFFGRPVVGMKTPLMETHLRETSDSALIARNAREYVDLVTRLIRDADFYRDRATVAAELGRRATDVGGACRTMIDSVMAACESLGPAEGA